MNFEVIKGLLAAHDPEFWTCLRTLTAGACEFDEVLFLSALRRKAALRGIAQPQSAGSVRLAILGGCSLYPLHELLTHFIETAGIACELFLGDYDNYVSEIMDSDSGLYRFRPGVVLLVPGPQRCRYAGQITDSREAAESAACVLVNQLLNLCKTAHERSKAEILLCNFMLPARHDPGEFRTRTLTSDWNFRKWINLQLGLNAPAFVRICDLEFLVNRRGALIAEDARGWFESKQPCSPALLTDLCREAAHLIQRLRQPPKKVLALDLDNTLWGGVVADDGIEGIEVGDTSPRGESFKAFQKSIATLKQRGVLLAVCSKNDHERALEAFEKHPEMVLRREDFVSFKANWNPKSDNLREMAAELNLGLDSFVFVDDNPAEIEIVRQFTPQVATLQLSSDPSEYVSQLQDCRWFEPRGITREDLERTNQYRAESERQTLLASVTDMDSYLASLEMEAVIQEFNPADAPRIAQLINKSNQFNLTTRRRTEAEVQALIGNPGYVPLTARLRDRFGDHGLISVVIGRVNEDSLEIDTWLMSCRVLKRQVEETLLNELVRRAESKGCVRLQGRYRATPKNAMVRDFYSRMGFQTIAATPECGSYLLELDSFQPYPTKISLRPAL